MHLFNCCPFIDMSTAEWNLVLCTGSDCICISTKLLEKMMRSEVQLSSISYTELMQHHSIIRRSLDVDSG
jgi:hypothetical protein